MLKSLLLTFLFSLFWLVPSASATQTTLDSRLGIVLAAPAYPDRHDSGDILSYGAKRAYELGFRSLEIWLYYPNVCTKNTTTPYGFYQNLSWCNTNRTFKQPRLAWLASQSEYQRVFSLPFSTYFLTIDSLNPDALNQFKINQGENLATQTEKDLLYQDIYEFTRHLLTTYSNTDKTFILMTGNELEWRVTQKTGCRPNCNSTPADPISVQLAIDWINTADQAIKQAKIDTPPNNINIYHATEINHVLTKDKGVPSALTEVLPNINVDLVGWSAHELKGFFGSSTNFSQLTSQGLNKIAQQVKDSPHFGTRNVYISEFGLNEMSASRMTYFDKVADIVRSSLDWGSPYFVYWALFDNECEVFNPNNEQCSGLWVVKPDNTLGKVYTDILSRYQVAPSPTGKPGDFNHDNQVNLADYNLLVNGYGTTYNLSHYNQLVANYGR